MASTKHAAALEEKICAKIEKLPKLIHKLETTAVLLDTLQSLYTVGEIHIQVHINLIIVLVVSGAGVRPSHGV